ncbi:MAG: 50S ribosomal protein L30 [Euryarchaeota archaeon]|nr:50S ribosomal protein L30 [Euryarchaeota archaeon]
MAFAVIRVRGNIDTRHDIGDTLTLLRLNRINHCVVIPQNDVYRGMLQKAKDYITWGEVSDETLSKMIQARGRLSGDRIIDDAYIAENTSYEDMDAFAKGIIAGEIKYADLKDVKPLFRLHPPKQGYEGVKRPFTLKGALGYRGEKINILIERML